MSVGSRGMVDDIAERAGVGSQAVPLGTVLDRILILSKGFLVTPILCIQLVANFHKEMTYAYLSTI